MDVCDIYWGGYQQDVSPFNVQYLHFCGYFSDGFGVGATYPDAMIKAGYKLQKYLRLMEWDKTFQVPRPVIPKGL